MPNITCYSDTSMIDWNLTFSTKGEIFPPFLRHSQIFLIGSLETLFGSTLPHSGAIRKGALQH